MSKALSRVRALVSEIESIQSSGQKSTVGLQSRENPIPHAIEPVAAVSQSAPTEIPAEVQQESEGKIMIRLSGKIVVQLQLEHSEEVVEVCQKGNLIEIRFMDGKAIHLPLRSVA